MRGDGWTDRVWNGGSAVSALTRTTGGIRLPLVDDEIIQRFIEIHDEILVVNENNEALK